MPQTFDRGKSIEGNTSAGRPRIKKSKSVITTDDEAEDREAPKVVKDHEKTKTLPVDMDKGKYQVGPKKRKVEMVVEIPEITVVHSPKKQDKHQATHSSKLFENDLPKPSTEELASTSG
jgi:hypothetical protein